MRRHIQGSGFSGMGFSNMANCSMLGFSAEGRMYSIQSRASFCVVLTFWVLGLCEIQDRRGGNGTVGAGRGTHDQIRAAGSFHRSWKPSRCSSTVIRWSHRRGVSASYTAISFGASVVSLCLCLRREPLSKPCNVQESF